MNDALTPGRTRKGISGEAAIRGMDEMAVLEGGAPQTFLVMPNVISPSDVATAGQ